MATPSESVAAVSKDWVTERPRAAPESLNVEAAPKARLSTHSIFRLLFEVSAQIRSESLGNRKSMSTRLYVGNLSYNTSQADLEAFFAAAGEVREVAIPTDRETGQPRGFAFVTMSSASAANSAIAQLNGSMLDGRNLKVNEAQERPARSGGGGGGGFGGGGGGRGRY